MSEYKITPEQLDKYKKCINDECKYKYYFTNDEKGENINDESIFVKSYEHLKNTLSEEIAKKRYSTLILLVGFSIQPLVLSISVLKPKKVYLLYSKETNKYCDKIQNWTEKFFIKNKENVPSFLGKDEWGKSGSQYKVESSNPADTYHKILLIVEKDNDGSAIDITGGKKTMVSGAFSLASLKNIDTYYVDFDEYDGSNPKPGTEILKLQENPNEQPRSKLRGILIEQI